MRAMFDHAILQNPQLWKVSFNKDSQSKLLIVLYRFSNCENTLCLYTIHTFKKEKALCSTKNTFCEYCTALSNTTCMFAAARCAEVRWYSPRTADLNRRS